VKIEDDDELQRIDNMMNELDLDDVEDNILPYKAPMLPDVDYQEIEDDDFSFSLIDLEYDTQKSCCDFLEMLKLALMEEHLMQVPDLLVAHLCAYLGTVMTVHTVHGAEKLEPFVEELIKHQALAAYHYFNQYPINSTVKDHEQKKDNLDKLRQVTPGSILVQTIRLCRMMMDMLEELKNHRQDFIYFHKKNKQQDKLCCSQDMFIKIALSVSGEKCAEWRDELGGLSDHYVINQLAIQIGWIIGYFSHIEEKSPEGTRYFDYGLPMIHLYREHVYKLMGSFATHVQQKQEEQEESEHSEIKKLLTETRQLSEKAHRQAPIAITDLQKQSVIVQAGIEKVIIELLGQEYAIKLILMSLFYFWFTLEAPLCSKDLKCIDQEDPFSHMGTIIELVQKTVNALPRPELTPEVKALNEKMQRLKQYLPNPEAIDNVSREEAVQQTAHINKAIHTVSCDYLKQNIHLEIVANALFSHWMRLPVLFGVSESDWQKMDYYLPDILNAVKEYLATLKTD